ncbi:MAG: polyphosphate:AMP phosphotransferase [Methanoregulaceae archaeon]
MFEQFNLDLSLDKSEYEREIPALRERLGVLQRRLRDLGVPAIIVFEGWRASGISGTINKISYALDPRGYRVHPIHNPLDIEREHSLMWRFWIRTPEKGSIAIFDRSWYSRIFVELLNTERELSLPYGALEDALAMEDQLENDGALIIRFFLHIDRKEQKRRLQKMAEKHPELVTGPPGIHGKQKEYERLLPYVEKLIIKTDRPSRPWTIVEATDKHYATVKVFRTIIHRMEDEIRRQEAAGTKPKNANVSLTGNGSPSERHSILAKADLTKSLPESEYKTRINECQHRLGELQFAIHNLKVPVILVFEGWDAAGKGGVIIRLNQALNPRCSVVEPISAPLLEERDHHYLWRFYRRFPRNGTITIFDRSWYGRVLVERVEGLAAESEWSRAYQEINTMEESLVRNGAILQKFWLHIDKETQLARFREREADPLKKYKITPEDWRNREKWDEYEVAVNEMLQKTSTPSAPWTIVESKDKYYSRVTIMEAIIREIEKKLKE